MLSRSSNGRSEEARHSTTSSSLSVPRQVPLALTRKVSSLQHMEVLPSPRMARPRSSRPISWERVSRSWSRLDCIGVKFLNPNIEIRNPKQIRNSNGRPVCVYRSAGFQPARPPHPYRASEEKVNPFKGVVFQVSDFSH